MTPNATQPLTPVVFHVLLSLADGALHGYAIMKRAEAESGLTMGPGAVYGALDRLAKSGWIVEADGADGDRDARRGRTFELTAEGRAALEAEARRITRLAGLSGVRRFAEG